MEIKKRCKPRVGQVLYGLNLHSSEIGDCKRFVPVTVFQVYEFIFRIKSAMMGHIRLPDIYRNDTWEDAWKEFRLYESEEEYYMERERG